MAFTWAVLLLPLLGTVLGSLGVFGLGEMRPALRRALEGAAAGVMTAASVWSLLLPAIETSANWGVLAFLPAAVGLWSGFLFLLAMEKRSPREQSMLLPAVTIHNLPEGMAVGVALAAFLQTGQGKTGVFALALGIALQNIPEGAIVSMPLYTAGMGKTRSFFWGAASGAVEPVGAFLTLLLAAAVTPMLPFFLSFAAGAMLFVVAGELIPGMQGGKSGVLSFCLGFTVMMALDVALG